MDSSVTPATALSQADSNVVLLFIRVHSTSLSHSGFTCLRAYSLRQAAPAVLLSRYSRRYEPAAPGTGLNHSTQRVHGQSVHAFTNPAFTGLAQTYGETPA